MEIAVAAVAAAAVVAAYQLLRTGGACSQSTGLFRLTKLDLPMLAVLAACPLVLYVPIHLRIPDDQRLLMTFSPDFSQQAKLAEKMVERGSFDLYLDEEPATRARHANAWRFSYGCLHINATILLSRAVSIFGRPSYATIARIHASLLLAGLIATIFLLYAWGRGIAGPVAGLIAGLVYLLPYKSTFLVVHACSPDHIQQVFMLGSLMACAVLASRSGLRNALVASALAGVAFGTKYAGVFLLPLILAAAFVRPEGRKRLLNLRALAALGAVVAGGFALGFAYASPQAVRHPLYFLGCMRDLSRSLNYSGAFSGGVVSSYARLIWQGFLYRDLPLVCAFGIGFAVLLLGGWWRPGKVRDYLVLAALAGTYAGVLLCLLRYVDPGVLYPVWPTLALAAGVGLVGLGRAVRRLIRVRTQWVPSAIAMAVFAGIIVHEFVGRRAAFTPTRVDRPLLLNYEHPFYAGLRRLASFLQQRYPANTRIIVDYTMIYVPRAFADVHHSSFVFLGTLPSEVLESTDVFVLSRKDSEFGEALKQGYYDEDKILLSRQFYRQVRDGRRFRKVTEIDYPSGWLASKVEVWERLQAKTQAESQPSGPQQLPRQVEAQGPTHAE